MLKEKTKFLFILFGGMTLAGMFLVGILAPAQAAPALQLTEFPTPTPGPDGRIVYTAQDGDSQWRIAAVAGISLDEFRRLNNLDADSIIRPGQVLLLGVLEAVQPTLAPGETPEPGTFPTPTPTGIADAGSICALLYLDVNGNSIREDGEIALADGEVSVTERLGRYSDKRTTTFQDEPVCFENIPPGEYLITMALPGGMNRTTELSASVNLAAGDTSYLNFGAQPAGVYPTIGAGVDDGGGSSSGSLVMILGVTLLLAGVGVGVWAALGNRRRFSE
ncbi:MAG: LysM peptidoglycan-binding domain-containing protein [Anaerolineales bacterium]